MIIWILVGLVVLLLLAGIAIYNRLVRLRQLVREGFSGNYAAGPTSSPTWLRQSKAMPRTSARRSMPSRLSAPPRLLLEMSLRQRRPMRP